MLRLDPAHPPLWRDATTLQFGLDDLARLDEPEPWEEHLLAELVRGIPDNALAGMLRSRRIRRAQADAFFAELQPVLQRTPPPPRIVLQTSDEVEAPVADVIAAALERTGASVRLDPWTPFTRSLVPAGWTAIVLATHVVEPRRAAALMSEDVRHLPLMFDGTGATVGPVIEPGVTACLACDAAHARDRDPAWPLLASQLVARRCEVDPDLAVEAARVAVQILTAPTTTPARSLRLRADAPNRVWRVHPPHEECGCRSLAGNATGSAPSVLDRATSSPTGFALPA
jgi:hypothetical protein